MGVKIKAFMARVWAVFKEAHSHADTYVTYVVSACVTLQAMWGDFESYIPKGWQHTILGIAGAVVIFDRFIKSVKATQVQ